MLTQSKPNFSMELGNMVGVKSHLSKITLTDLELYTIFIDNVFISIDFS